MLEDKHAAQGVGISKTLLSSLGGNMRIGGEGEI